MNVQDRANEILSSASSNAILRVLLNRGYLKFLANDQATDKFLELAYADQLAGHLADRCRCDFTDWGFGYCYIAEWYEGCRPGWEVIVDMEEERFDYYFEKYIKSA